MQRTDRPHQRQKWFSGPRLDAAGVMTVRPNRKRTRKIIPAASERDCMVEHLDYLHEHYTQCYGYTCPECERYRVARGVLLESIFPEETDREFLTRMA